MWCQWWWISYFYLYSMWRCGFAFVSTFIASLSCWASYWAGLFNRANTTSSRSPFRAFFIADSRGYNEFKHTLRKCWPWAFPVFVGGFFCFALYYLSTGVLKSLFNLLPLVIAPFYQNVNYGFFIHTFEKKKFEISISAEVYFFLSVAMSFNCFLG